MLYVKIHGVAAGETEVLSDCFSISCSVIY